MGKPISLIGKSRERSDIRMNKTVSGKVIRTGLKIDGRGDV
jgi:hypothetical protein